MCAGPAAALSSRASAQAAAPGRDSCKAASKHNAARDLSDILRMDVIFNGLTGSGATSSITPSRKRTCVLDDEPPPGGPRLPFAGPPWEDPGLADQALQRPA